MSEQNEIHREFWTLAWMAVITVCMLLACVLFQLHRHRFEALEQRISALEHKGPPNADAR